MSELVPQRRLPLSPELERLTSKAEALSRPKVAKSTERIYESDFRIFEAFCADYGLSAMPAEPLTIAQFIADRIDHHDAPTTLDRRLAAIRWKHQLEREADPTKHEQLREIRRNAVAELSADRDKRQNTPFTVARLKKAISELNSRIKPEDDGNAEPVPAKQRRESDIAVRDRALFLVTFAAAFRPSETASLKFRHLHAEFDSDVEGYRIKGMKAKNDPTGRRVIKGIPKITVPGLEMLCPVTALDAWYVVAKRVCGKDDKNRERYAQKPNDFVFRTLSLGTNGELPMRAEDIARRVEKIARDCGLRGFFRGHALRAGHITSADAAGVSLARIKAQSGHKSDRMVGEYVRHSRAIRESPLFDILGIGPAQQLPLGNGENAETQD